MILSNRSHIPSVPATMTSVAEAQALADNLTRTMAALKPLIDQETALVRAGKLRDAMATEQQKAELSRQYSAIVAVLKANQPFMRANTPQLLADMLALHEGFRDDLQVNLTVLATAHAVSEGIIRGVNGEMQRRSMPSTYTAAGNKTAPGPRHVTPLAVSRSL